ncbi:MBL fold metallo-hydrolase [Changpingibacter yushuensis]|uniref:MBL fold metallo-hydrolase n=1 Tax=Changpingibacter yushuensis TaxID=2758440 RepID=UPI00165DEFC8|nr:MBL fold metallo-hydrolase [Changpingibacter yushuensis]
MIFLRYSQTLIEANCYIIADSEAKQALVVDPGAGSAHWVETALASHGLEINAVLCTHGHSDHVWDSAVVAGGAPVFVPGPDLYRMEDPSMYTAAFRQAFVDASGHDWEKPADTRELPAALLEGGGAQIVPGIAMRALPAPGHTEGSTVFLLSGSIDDDVEAVSLPEGSFGTSLMLSGDVLFRDGVGRTDLPGGDPVAAAESLRTLTQVIAPATVFFPGHGAPSTMGREMRHSLYLRQAMEQGR